MKHRHKKRGGIPPPIQLTRNCQRSTKSGEVGVSLSCVGAEGDRITMADTIDESNLRGITEDVDTGGTNSFRGHAGEGSSLRLTVRRPVV